MDAGRRKLIRLSGCSLLGATLAPAALQMQSVRGQTAAEAPDWPTKPDWSTKMVQSQIHRAPDLPYYLAEQQLTNIMHGMCAFLIMNEEWTTSRSSMRVNREAV